MSLKLNEWEAEIKKLDKAKLPEIEKALKVLEQWEVFKEAFDWTGMFTIGRLITFESEDRK